jgi:hypothetical protein
LAPPGGGRPRPRGGGGVNPRARRNPLEGGVNPRARQNLLEGAFEWASLVGRGDHRSVGRAPCVCLSEMSLVWSFAGFKQDFPGCFRGPSGLSPTDGAAGGERGVHGPAPGGSSEGAARSASAGCRRAWSWAPWSCPLAVVAPPTMMPSPPPSRHPRSRHSPPCATNVAFPTQSSDGAPAPGSWRRAKSRQSN